MEMVDHAVRYDWQSAALLLGRDHRSEVNLAEEQRGLLYGEGENKDRNLGRLVRVQGRSETALGAIPPDLPGQPPSVLSLTLQGWGKRNVLSSRAAWARVRLLEKDMCLRTGPGGLRPLPGAKPPPQAQSASASKWFNEDQTEEDKTLALLSEATELYLKSLLEGAVNAARNRQNLDGVRLWHKQHTASAGAGQSPQQQVNGDNAPLCLRLGCDVRRQVALAEGNAAKTVQRMEEALYRQVEGRPNSSLRDDGVLYSATCMSDLSKRPRLSSAASRADHDAKRCFEIFGGKGSGAPPFGRVPKKAKIMVKDFRHCLEDPAFPWRRGGVVATAFM